MNAQVELIWNGKNARLALIEGTVGEQAIDISRVLVDDLRKHVPAAATA